MIASLGRWATITRRAPASRSEPALRTATAPPPTSTTRRPPSSRKIGYFAMGTIIVDRRRTDDRNLLKWFEAMANIVYTPRSFALPSAGRRCWWTGLGKIAGGGSREEAAC